jgi:hypothetical protein
VTCSLCDQRRARRDCPALGRQICSVCCGTKRLVQIDCPSTCVYLSSSREHPPAAATRRHQNDLDLLRRSARDLNERQSELFFKVSQFLSQYAGSDFPPLLDNDVAEAARALAATLETSARGVIYEHRPASLPAERLAVALTPLLAESRRRGGSVFESAAAVVLRRVAEAVGSAQSSDGGNRRAFLDLLKRVIRSRSETATAKEAPDEVPRLIVS